MSETPAKKINVQIINRDAPGGTSAPYRIMEEMIEKHHEHLLQAKVALAWRYGWKEDADGRLKLDQCRKASDLDRELHGYDFVILLNHEAWNAADFSQAHMTALIDHELCHAMYASDPDTGEVKRDEQGRPVWRVRGHDVEEFQEIVSRHGCWTMSLERLAKAAMEKADRPLFARAPGPSAHFPDHETLRMADAMEAYADAAGDSLMSVLDHADASRAESFNEHPVDSAPFDDDAFAAPPEPIVNMPGRLVISVRQRNGGRWACDYFAAAGGNEFCQPMRGNFPSEADAYLHTSAALNLWAKGLTGLTAKGLGHKKEILAALDAADKRLGVGVGTGAA